MVLGRENNLYNNIVLQTMNDHIFFSYFIYMILGRENNLYNNIV